MDVDARLLGRLAEVTVPWGPAFEARAREAFRRRFGVEDAASSVEVVRMRARAFGARAALRDGPRRPRRPRAGPPFARFDGLAGPVPAWRREDLGAGARIRGEALVVEAGATTWVPRGGSLEVGDDGTLRVRGEAS